MRCVGAVENRRLSGGLPATLVRAVTDGWERCLKILASQIERGVSQGTFRSCDPWAVANIFWIVANGLIQTEEYPERRDLRALGPSQQLDKFECRVAWRAEKTDPNHGSLL